MTYLSNCSQNTNPEYSLLLETTASMVRHLGVVLDQDTDYSTHPLTSSAEIANVFGAVPRPVRCANIGMSRDDLYPYLTNFSTKPSHELRHMLSLPENMPTRSQKSSFGYADSSYGQDETLEKYLLYNEQRDLS